MRLVSDSGAWTAGQAVAEAPAVAVLEVSGAILAWTVDDPIGASATRVTITDVAAADWLWRIVGETGHMAIVASPASAEFELVPSALEPLRRLAVGHWLRRWWPESSRDGIARLDPALLDGELAILTEAAQDFFTEDTLDSDVTELLAPHRAALSALGRGVDPRVAALASACAELAADVGAWPGSDVPAALDDSVDRRRADYALVAGGDAGRAGGAIAGGVASVRWACVPPATFDAADDTVDWSITPADASVVATVRVGLTGVASPRGVEVALRAGDVSGEGVLDANGVVALALVGPDGRPLTEDEAWDHDWSTATIVIGVDRGGEDATVRQRIRDFARGRLTHPGADAFLAEILAAESDY